MKPTLTAADPVGWYLCNHRSPARVVDLPMKWNGRDLMDAFGIDYDIREFTNFRRLVEHRDPMANYTKRAVQPSPAAADEPIVEKQA